MMIDNLTRL